VTIAARFVAVAVAVAAVACRAKSPPEQGASVVSPDANPDASPDASDAASPDASVVAHEEFPNARIRLKLHFHAPALPERTIEQTIWLSGTRFHVRDEAGRALYEILGDVTYPRGLGLPATTMEEIMDRKAAARRKPSAPTDIYGDVASNTAPIARQVLSGDRTATFTRGGEVTRLGRKATEYKGAIEVQENGRPMKTDVLRVVASPYVLFDEARDSQIADFYYVREVVALDEGVVTDADVTPPSP
jgi:hypothetical protein